MLSWTRRVATAGVAMVTVALTVALGGAAFAAPGVTPASVSLTLLPGQSAQVQKSVETSPIPPMPDIVFLADTTGSMGPAITNVRNNATAIMNAVRAEQADSQFGAAEYRDFNCSDPFAYRLNQAITSSIPSAQAGINQWAIGNGCDTPEAQLNALFELATNPATAFRPGSSRIVAWFGDASGHNPSGGHTLAQTIAALQAASIRVVAVNVASGFGDGLNATGQASAIAMATGGNFFPSATNDQVADAILAGLSNLPVAVTHTVSCDPGVSASLLPASRSGTSGDTFSFDETVSVDAGTLAGVYECTVEFLVNGVSTGDPAFVEEITITVPAPDLRITKTGPAQVTEGDNIVYSLVATNLGPTTATGVVVTDPVPAGTTFVSASAGCAQAAGIVTCTAGTLAPGASRAFSITVLALPGNSVTNIATVAGLQPDPNLANNVASVTTSINLNPVCTAASTGLGDLWPPNHKYVAGQISGVTDADGDPVTLTITGITQDEPVDGAADGNTSPDATIGSGGAFSVRAERAGTEDGRVYAIAFRATDGLGGACVATLLAGVPHDQGNGSTPVNSAPPWFDSTTP